MSTELLFRENAYLKTATARVLAVHERGIELDRTIFYFDLFARALRVRVWKHKKNPAKAGSMTDSER